MLTSSADVLARRAVRRLGSSLCGRYTLRHVIGIGGMAAVYAGVHRNGHAVAIKILHERLAADPEIERLFRREAQLANRIDHPGVVPVIDDDITEDGCVFLVMPLLEGETARARSERMGRILPVADVLVIADAVLGVLASAHARRIVHRDIKPENIFVTREGELRVLDFGIGRFFETNDAGTSATRSGRAFGTPAFMAPEQALGRHRDVDGRTDIWALGATMFTLLSGRFVHEAESLTELSIAAATKAAPSLGSVVPAVPQSLSHLIDCALAFDRGDRWSDAHAMAQALQSASLDALGMATGDLPKVIPPRHAPANDFDEIPTQSTPGRAPSTEGERFDRTTPPSRTTVLDEGATRTQSPVVGHPRRPWLLIPAALAACGALLAMRTFAPQHSALPLTQKAGASTAPSNDDAKVGSLNADALRAYHEGISLWYAASPSLAARQFGRAAELDPSFAAPHLWIVLLAPLVRTATREHFARATQLRHGLSIFEQDLLDVLVPAMSSRPDWGPVISGLEALETKFPSHAETHLLLAYRLRLAFEPERALTVADSIDETIPLKWSVRGYAYDQLDRLDDARGAFQRCLEIAPSSTSCSQMLLQLEASEGHCTRTEALARQLIARAPESPIGYEFLANSLFGMTGSVATARAVLEQRWARLDVPARSTARFPDAFSLAVLEGDLTSAQRILSEWESAIAALPDSSAHGELAYERMQLARALGDDSLVVDLGRQNLDLARAWAPDEVFDLRMATLSMLYRAGGLSRLDFRKERETWLKNPGEALLFFNVPSFRWTEAYASATKDREDALDALAHMPATHPAFFATLRNPGMDEMLGRTFASAGDSPEALRYFIRATSACTIANPIDSTLAFLELAQLSEKLRDTPRACASYEQVSRRWGNEPLFQAGRIANERLASLHCKHEKQIGVSHE